MPEADVSPERLTVKSASSASAKRKYQDLTKFVVPPDFRGRPSWYVQLWWIVQDTFFRCSPQFMFGWRVFLLRLFGAKLGNNVRLRPTVRVTYPWKLTI